VAFADSVTWVALSTLRITAAAGISLPLSGIPGDIGVLPPLVVSDSPVMTGEPLLGNTVLLDGDGVEQIDVGDAVLVRAVAVIPACLENKAPGSLMFPDWKPSDVVPSSTFCAVASAATSSARPVAVLSDMVDESWV
jgi:hypothetical protein